MCKTNVYIDDNWRYVCFSGCIPLKVEFNTAHYAPSNAQNLLVSRINGDNSVEMISRKYRSHGRFAPLSGKSFENATIPDIWEVL